jgi:UDP-perosamine 4-acetyltransferase
MDVYLIGGGGHGSVVLDSWRVQGKMLNGIIDPGLTQGVPHRSGLPVLGGDAVLDALDRNTVRLLNGVGERPGVHLRREVHQRLGGQGFQWVSVLHPSAVIARDARLGYACQVMAGSVLQTGVELGEGSVVNTRSSVDHNCLVGEHVFISPGVTLCGGVCIEDGAFIGVGAVILPGVRIGAHAIVGAGAVVTRPVSPGATVLGNPARESKKSEHR